MRGLPSLVFIWGRLQEHKLTGGEVMIGTSVGSGPLLVALIGKGSCSFRADIWTLCTPGTGAKRYTRSGGAVALQYRSGRRHCGSTQNWIWGGFVSGVDVLLVAEWNRNSS